MSTEPIEEGKWWAVEAENPDGTFTRLHVTRHLPTLAAAKRSVRALTKFSPDSGDLRIVEITQTSRVVSTDAIPAAEQIVNHKS